MLRNTKTSYGSVARFFHWLMALMVIAMFGVAYTMINMAPSPEQGQLFALHKATGVTILMLVVARLLWRWMNVVPPLSRSLPQWQKTAAHYNYMFLYFLLFAMPLSGLLMSILGGHSVSWFGIFTIPPFSEKSPTAGLFVQAHIYLSYLLIATFAVHVLAAFYHHFYLKDNVLTRMLWGRTNG